MKTVVYRLGLRSGLPNVFTEQGQYTELKTKAKSKNLVLTKNETKQIVNLENGTSICTYIRVTIFSNLSTWLGVFYF